MSQDRERKSKPIDPRLTNRRQNSGWCNHPADHEYSSGEDHRTSKLKESDIHAIRDYFQKNGGTIKEMAKKFNLSSGYLGRILKGRVWRHLGLSNLLYIAESEVDA